MPDTEVPIALVCHGLAASNSKAASPKDLENPTYAGEERKATVSGKRQSS